MWKWTLWSTYPAVPKRGGGVDQREDASLHCDSVMMYPRPVRMRMRMEQGARMRGCEDDDEDEREDASSHCDSVMMYPRTARMRMRMKQRTRMRG